MKPKTYNVVRGISKHPSFSWANGLYIELEEEYDGFVSLCRLDENGNPETHDDGRFMVSLTGRSNIIPTGITYTHDPHDIKANLIKYHNYLRNNGRIKEDYDVDEDIFIMINDYLKQ